MNLGLKNKNVLVTGSSRGIGLSIAKGFLEEGANVCLVSRGSKKLFESERTLKKYHGAKKVFAIKCDCSDTNSLNSASKKIKALWGRLDIAVINVGSGLSTSEALPSNDDWEMCWNKNFESALQTSRTFLPMLNDSKGNFLFISSIAGKESFGAPTAYSTAKAAIIALSKNMARKLAPDVRVNVLAPGNVYFKDGSWDDKIKKNKHLVEEMLQEKVPMNRFAAPEEISDAAIFLCSERAKFITGTTLVIDGGQTVGYF
jgi:3-oxoacyl-[acyl-carrier protein] reductase